MGFIDDLLRSQRIQLLKLYRETEDDIVFLYEEIIEYITLNIKKKNKLNIKEIDLVVDKAKKGLDIRLQTIISSSIKSAVILGSSSSTEILKEAVKRARLTDVLSLQKIEQETVKANKLAIKAIENRDYSGKTLSKRIWEISDSTGKSIKEVLKSGIAEKQGAIQLANSLEKYVKNGKKTFAREYPNMMKRIEYLPENLNYEGLRLARTEMVGAFSKSNRERGQNNPFVVGMRYQLSPAHPKKDICDTMVEQDLYGLGPGCYPLDNLPDYPFHPNCICVELYLFDRDITKTAAGDESIDDLMDGVVGRLKNWYHNPEDYPEIEDAFREWKISNYS